jgi:hypothetical protein
MDITQIGSDSSSIWSSVQTKKKICFLVVPFSFGFLGEEEDCFGRVVVKLVARYFLEVESVSKLSTHVSSSVQLSFTTMGGWRGGGVGGRRSHLL